MGRGEVVLLCPETFGLKNWNGQKSKFGQSGTWRTQETDSMLGECVCDYFWLLLFFYIKIVNWRLINIKLVLKFRNTITGFCIVIRLIVFIIIPQSFGKTIDYKIRGFWIPIFLVRIVELSFGLSQQFRNWILILNLEIWIPSQIAYI